MGVEQSHTGKSGILPTLDRVIIERGRKKIAIAKYGRPICRFRKTERNVWSGKRYCREIMHAMWKPQKFKYIYLLATLYVFTLTLPSASAMYWAFGDELLTHSNAFSLLPKTRFRDAAVVLMLIHQVRWALIKSLRTCLFEKIRRKNALLQVKFEMQMQFCIQNAEIHNLIQTLKFFNIFKLIETLKSLMFIFYSKIFTYECPHQPIKIEWGLRPHPC